MEKISNLKHFRFSMRVAFLIQCIILGTNAYAQQKKISTLEIKDIEAVYVDRPGDLYVQKKNTIEKFDIQGKLIREFKFDTPPTLFDPRDGARMFVYAEHSQQCSFFSAETNQEFLIEQQYAIEPVLACASGDHQLWVLDRSDWSLKKINPAQSKVIAEGLIDQKQFSISPQFTFMREYQNFLFLIEKNTGILIFNSLGLQIKKIEAPGIEYLNFLGEELYYKKNDTLIFTDIFDSSVREQAVEATCLQALVTDSRTFLTFANKIEIFENH